MITRSEFVHRYADPLAYLMGAGSVEILASEIEYKGLAIDELPLDLDDLELDGDEVADELADLPSRDFEQMLDEPVEELIFRTENITDEQLRIMRKYCFRLKRIGTEPGFVLAMFELPEE